MDSARPDVLALAHLFPRPLAFVFGGGGSRGAVQMGMMRALAQTDIRPDLVVGTSVGSLNGAITAADPESAAAVLADIWPRIDRQQVFPGGVVRQILSATRSRQTYVFDPTPLSDLLAEYLPVRTIEELAIPFTAITTDLDTGARYDIESGDLRTALLASSAIPVAFPWVERDGHRLVDGGLVANIPIRQAVDRGAKSVIVLDCGIFGAGGRWAEGMMGVIVQSVAIAGRAQITTDLAVARDVAVFYLPVPATIPTTVFDFAGTEALAEHAYGETLRAAREMAAHEALVGRVSPLPPGLYGDPPLTVLNPAVAALRPTGLEGP